MRWKHFSHPSMRIQSWLMATECHPVHWYIRGGIMAEQTDKCLDVSSWFLMPGKLAGASILSRDPALQSNVTIGTHSLPEKVNFSGISLIGTQVGHHSNIQ